MLGVQLFAEDVSYCTWLDKSITHFMLIQELKQTYGPVIFLPNIKHDIRESQSLYNNICHKDNYVTWQSLF